jgi:hypothetical protein
MQDTETSISMIIWHSGSSAVGQAVIDVTRLQGHFYTISIATDHSKFSVREMITNHWNPVEQQYMKSRLPSIRGSRLQTKAEYT